MTSPDKQAVSGIAGIPSAAHLTGWRLSAGDEHRVYDAEGNRIVDVACGGMSGRSFADAADVARLIAAAPELLEALQFLLECTINTAAKDEDPEEWEVVQKMRAAIAKARGQ